MKTIPIKISRKSESYKIEIGSGLIAKLPELFDFSRYSSVTIITDSNVGSLYVQSIKRLNIHDKLFVFTFPAGEQYKNSETVNNAYRFLTQHSVDRKGLIINLGGGVVTDLGGFVAATYLRGIDSINISTSLVGMIDASIGGKVGIDLDQYKNYIGSFYHPKMIIIDIDTLKTLSKRNLIAAFGEIIKHGLIADKTYFDFVTSKKPGEFTTAEMIEIIKGSCLIKKMIVEYDELEKGPRKLLNFGHTAGHAIESLSLKTKYPLLHGETVSIGIAIASKISEQLKLIDNKSVGKIIGLLKNASLPVSIPKYIKRQDIMDILIKDKKSIDGKITWILLQEIGETIMRDDIPNHIVMNSL